MGLEYGVVSGGTRGRSTFRRRRDQRGRRCQLQIRAGHRHFDANWATVHSMNVRMDNKDRGAPSPSTVPRPRCHCTYSPTPLTLSQGAGKRNRLLRGQVSHPLGRYSHDSCWGRCSTQPPKGLALSIELAGWGTGRNDGRPPCSPPSQLDWDLNVRYPREQSECPTR